MSGTLAGVRLQEKLVEVLGHEQVHQVRQVRQARSAIPRAGGSASSPRSVRNSSASPCW
ncbi:hypothetical protein ACWCQW_30780 [Streptomyces mirabilis]